jgi:hypothetical protein
MRTVFAAVTLSFLSFASGFAQHAPVIQVIRETVKEGKGAAHQKTEMEYVRAFQKAKSSGYYVALESLSGPNQVLFVAPMESFAFQEQMRNDAEKDPLKTDLEMAEAHDGELRESSHTMWAVYRDEMSYRPEAFEHEKARFVSIATYRIRFGKEEEMMKSAKMILDAYKKANLQISLLCYQAIAGAPAGTYLFFESMDSLKVMDGMQSRSKAYREAMGQDNLRQLMGSASELFTFVENNLFAINPKMSYVSKKTQDADPAFWRSK